MTTPGYVELMESGELGRRATALKALAARCRLCPLRCGAEREHGMRGRCGAGGKPSLMSYAPHHGEEQCISGTGGSGTLFFGHCNLHCVYCQNHDISQDHGAAQVCETPPAAVARAMLSLQALGCHNINLVSPTHNLDGIVEAFVHAAAQGLRIPIVYNSNGYDSVEALRLLDGIVDIYMPDLKYASDQLAEELSGVPHYARSAREAVVEMHRQAGVLQLDGAGIATRGLLIRHLVLPGDLSGTHATLGWIARTLGTDVTVNLMAQYHPAYQATRDARLARRLDPKEYADAVAYAHTLGLRSLLTQ